MKYRRPSVIELVILMYRLSKNNIDGDFEMQETQCNRTGDFLLIGCLKIIEMVILKCRGPNVIELVIFDI